MARFLADQNKVLVQIESGTYAQASGPGIWPGQVTDNSIDDAENLIETRFLGTATRNFDTMDQGPRDVTGTITYHPQDMRLVLWAIGSVADTSGTTTSFHRGAEVNTDVRQNVHTSGTLNPPKSWTLEDSKQSVGTGRNFVRTINGIIPNTVTVSATQGEKVSVEYGYIGQTLVYSSGATTALVEKTTPRSYLWSDSIVTIAGSEVNTARDVSLEINQNLDAPHYVTGSRDVAVPILGNRDYTLTVGWDVEGTLAANFYDKHFKSNLAFNSSWDLNADTTGSQHIQFVMSGCKIISMTNPSANEGATDGEVIIRPESLSAIEWTSGASLSEYAKV